MVVDAAVVVVGGWVVGVDSTAVVVVAIDVVGAVVATGEAVDGSGVATGAVVSAGSVVHPVKTTTANAAVAAKRNMLRPFTPPHTLAPATAHRHQVSPLHHRQLIRSRQEAIDPHISAPMGGQNERSRTPRMPDLDGRYVADTCHILEQSRLK